jgi:hypothetical protein
MEFLDYCTSLIHKLPVWDSHEKNLEFRVPIYERLARHWRIVIHEISCKIEAGTNTVYTGKMFGAAIIGGWAHNVAVHCQETKGFLGFKEVSDDFKEKIGWVIGLEGL